MSFQTQESEVGIAKMWATHKSRVYGFYAILKQIAMSNFSDFMREIEDEALASPGLAGDMRAYRTRLTIARELRAARRASGMTQQDLAAASGIGQPEISDIERGENATLSTLSRLCAALGVDLHLTEAAPAGLVRT